MIKRFVAMLLCVAMLTSMLPVQTRAEDSQMLPLPVAAETTAPEETAEETATTEAAEPTQTTTPSADETEGTEPDITESVLETETAAQESIHEHVYEALVTEPTCTEAGYTTYTCECGDSYVADYVDPIVAYKCLEVQMERGSVTYNYDLGYSSSHYKNYVRTAYDIRTGGAARVSIEKFAAAHGTVYIQFFSADYTKVSSTAYTDEAVVDIPEGCDFIRVEIQTTEDLEKIAIRFYEGTGEPREAKRAAKNELSEKLTYKVSDEIHTTSRLMLPPNYSTDGEKVPLILWLEGSGSSLSTWDGDFNSNKLPYLQYLRDEGFAVFSVYAWGNEYAEKYPGCGKSFPYPIPINLACIKAGIEYICDRYNIDADDIHIMSKSQGGQCALYYASRNELNVKTIGMFAPVLDYLSMPGEALYRDTRAAIADELDFTGDVAYFASDRFLSYSDEGRAFLRQNLDKLFTMNEAWTNLGGATPEELFESSMDDCETFWTEQIWKTNRTDIYTHAEYVKTASVPVKIWGAQDDAATPYLKMVEVVQQLKNGGAVADLRTLPNGTGAHSCADIGSTRVDVTTALGIEHANVPIGWVENIQWIRSGGVSEEIHSHSYESTVTPPTCTEQGYTTYTCDCGDSYIADYVDATGHTYSNGTCTGCGADHPELADYSGKVISIMGDSISTFAGYIPTADGFNLEHLARYPQDNLLTDVNETWWMQVIDALGAKLGINDSWRGATLSGGAPVTTGTTGENAAMSNLTRIRNLGANGTPDMILLYGGTNDLAHVSKVGSFDKNTAPTVVDLTTAKWDNLADGFVHTLLRMRHFYPDAKIVALLPAPTTSYYADAKLNEGNQVMIQICDHYGIPYVDLRSCGITTADLPDGIHPDETGMDFISAAVVDAVLENCDLAAGENKVYAVSHQLTNATAQKHYYKGVSAGLVFEETLAGDNLQVTVTMGGTDITAEVYKNGKITIPKVTGDLVITAKARFSLGARLQPLPEKICGSTNLWPLLKHDTDYYTGTKWAAHATGVVRSATIPVEPGQRLWATSFGAAKANGGAINGIRLTWFGEDGVLESVGADAVYAEFAAKGYVEVPEGANAANVVMWNDKDGNELYILDLSHIYEEGRCIGCGNSLLKGDVDLDGDVDAADLTRLTRHMAEIETISDPAALKNADVTGDGQIRPDDQTKLARYIGKIISSLD